MIAVRCIESAFEGVNEPSRIFFANTRTVARIRVSDTIPATVLLGDLHSWEGKDSHLRTAPPMLMMLGVYGAAGLLDVSWLLDLVTWRTSLEVVNETLWRTAC